MEPKVKRDLSYRDLAPVLTALSFWSKKGIQNFIEKGTMHDVVDASRNYLFDRKKVCGNIRALKQFGCIYDDEDDCCDDVSLSQAVKIIHTAQTNSRREWENIFDLITLLSANSKYFDDNNFSYVERDVVRIALCLKPFNRIYKNDQGQEVLFHRAGNCPVWENAPAGYRYATPEEVSVEAVENLSLVATHVNHYGWAMLFLKERKVTCDGVVAIQYFKNNVFYVPLVKI